MRAVCDLLQFWRHNKRISICGTWSLSSVRAQSGLWTRRCWSSPKTVVTWLPFCSPGPKLQSPCLLLLHLKRACGHPREEARHPSHPRALASLRSVGFQSCGRDPRRKPCACAIKWANAAIRTADSNMRVAIQNRMARLAEDLIQPVNMRRLRTDLGIFRKVFHSPVQRFSLSSLIHSQSMQRRFHQRILRLCSPNSRLHQQWRQCNTSLKQFQDSRMRIHHLFHFHRHLHHHPISFHENHITLAKHCCSHGRVREREFFWRFVAGTLAHFRLQWKIWDFQHCPLISCWTQGWTSSTTPSTSSF